MFFKRKFRKTFNAITDDLGWSRLSDSWIENQVRAHNSPESPNLSATDAALASFTGVLIESVSAGSMSREKAFKFAGMALVFLETGLGIKIDPRVEGSLIINLGPKEWPGTLAHKEDAAD